MAPTLKAAMPRRESSRFGRFLARLLARVRRPKARIDRLNEQMLRDIGLGERELPRLRYRKRV